MEDLRYKFLCAVIRIIEQILLERTLKGNLFQAHSNEEGHLQLDHVVQSLLQPDLECFQGWSLYHLNWEDGLEKLLWNMIFSLGWTDIAQHMQMSPKGADKKEGLTSLLSLCYSVHVGQTWRPSDAAWSSISRSDRECCVEFLTVSDNVESTEFSVWSAHRRWWDIQEKVYSR